MKPIDYRQFRFRRLNEPEFRHLLLLIFWPVFGLFFYCQEVLPSVFPNIFPVHYHPVYWPALDDIIPFCEWFFIPYIYWFVFIFGFLFYSLLYDIPAFKKYMYFVIGTYSMTVLIYFIYPTEQNLRPVIESNNFMARWVAAFYAFDTNTNVCPSIHVLGSLAVTFAAWDSKLFHSAGWRFFFVFSGILISISTVFLKQHSVIDVFAALVVCAVVYPFVFIKPDLLKNLFRKTTKRSE